MEVRALVLVRAAVSAPAAAQQVYKCVDGKAVAYQSVPCAGDAEKTWKAKPDSIDPVVQAQVDEVSQEMEARKKAQSAEGPRYAAVGTSVSISANSDRCDIAKRQRDQTLNAVSDRSTELMRRLDDAVYSACK